MIETVTEELRRVLRRPLSRPRDVRAAVQDALVNNMPRIMNRTISAVSASVNFGLFLDPDELTGVEVRTFTLNQLRGRVTPLRLGCRPVSGYGKHLGQLAKFGHRLDFPRSCPPKPLPPPFGDRLTVVRHHSPT